MINATNRRATALAVLLTLMFGAPSWATNGHVLHGVGSINQSMGGAGIATSLDALGSNVNNVFAPAIVQHHLTAGAAFNVTPEFELNLSYYHAFQNQESGQFISNGAAGPLNQPVPGTKVTNRMSEDSVSAQVLYRFQ